MAKFIYAVIDNKSQVIDVLKTREEAREVKRYLSSGSDAEQVKIVQYTPNKVVR